MKRAALSLLFTFVLAGCGSTHEKQTISIVKRTSGAAGIDCQPVDTTPIQWNGGPVIHGTVNVYLLYYGLSWTQSQTQILTNLAQSIGGSPYYNINTGYFDGSGHAASSVRLAGAVYLNNLWKGNSISDDDVWGFVTNQFIWQQFSADPNGLFLVLGDSHTIETSGFCSSYCGWHSHGNYNGVDIKYGFIGNALACSNPSVCLCGNTASSPNNDVGIDGMASVIAHELEETHTDPDGNAWYASDGAENADHCAWTYGSVQTAPNGSYYNMTLGNANYLIQQNWYATNGCGLSCSSGSHSMCSGVCVDLNTNLNNCGACGNDCAQLGAAYRCISGACTCTHVCCGGDVCATTCPRFCP
ncbi:MAG TPA: hypothetical protein VFF06_03280 [Polyangia bacterium]|nr:hypothetical protein [Polyangia bacterium]